MLNVRPVTWTESDFWLAESQSPWIAEPGQFSSQHFRDRSPSILGNPWSDSLIGEASLPRVKKYESTDTPAQMTWLGSLGLQCPGEAAARELTPSCSRVIQELTRGSQNGNFGHHGSEGQIGMLHGSPGQGTTPTVEVHLGNVPKPG